MKCSAALLKERTAKMAKDAPKVTLPVNTSGLAWGMDRMRSRVREAVGTAMTGLAESLRTRAVSTRPTDMAAHNIRLKTPVERHACVRLIGFPNGRRHDGR